MPKATNTPITMDSRKFLGVLNDSAQSKVAEFENHISEMGRKAGKNYKLAALNAHNLYFEDVDTNSYYFAEHKTDHGKVNISNIRPVQIKEGEKQAIFHESCCQLVDAIESNDQASMKSAFNRMKSHRFSSRTVPYSGYVKCRDNVTRQIHVATEDTLSDSTKTALIAAIVEGLRDQVLVENGQVVQASFSDGDPVKLPVTKWAARKLVAKKMRGAAENAYWSEGFQTRITNLAKLISEGKIEEAVSSISSFLNEMEEFTLLTRDKTQTLVENALASQAIFNQTLCDDTATLFHRTNLKISRRKIIDEWRNIAKVAEHPVLAENVQILEESSNFEAAYDKFLTLIFEAISNKEVAAEALATTLSVLRDKTPKIRESHDLSSKLQNLIARLKDPKFDDAAIYEAEDLIATIQEELSAAETLGSFDQMPGGDDLGLGGEEELDLGGDLGGEEAGSGTPVININSPLIQIGGSSSAGGAGDELGGEEDLGGLGDDLGGLGGEEEDLGGLGAEEELPEEEGNELEALLGGGGGGGLDLASKQKNKKPLSESRPKHYEMNDDDDDEAGPEDENLEESSDPYAIRKGENIAVENFNVNSYGAPVITDHKQLHQVATLMERLAAEHKLYGADLEANLESMAEASIKAIGLRIPEGRMGAALDQAVNVFNEMVSTGAIADFTGGSVMGDDDDDDDEVGLGDDDDVAEDQFKGPRIRGRGYRKTAYKPRELKNESIEWGVAQEDAMAGTLGGVNFIFDHGGANQELVPIILSEDGSVEIPIPEQLYDDAFAAANMVEHGNPARFTKWLNGSLEQLRPITDDEDRALEEAMAKITTTPEGGISVEVSDDVDVGGAGEMGEEGAVDAAMDAVGMDDAEGMEPVDAVDPMAGGEEEMAPADDAMPDYEGEDALDPGGEVPAAPADPAAAEQPAEQPAQPAQGGQMQTPDMGYEEEDPTKLEDKDVTEPSSSKYTKHVKDNKRDMPEHKPTKKTDDNLDSVGPTLKNDDGSGTKPPTAKAMSQK